MASRDRRPKAAPQAPKYQSDRYGGQMGFAKKDHQVCLAHLIRDVQYAIDAGDDVFAPDLRHLLGRACRIGQRMVEKLAIEMDVRGNARADNACDP